MARSRAKKNGTRKPTRAKADPTGFMEEISKQSGRISGEDLAYAVGNKFGGPLGFAEFMFEAATNSEASPATRAKIMQNLMTFIREISKQYGDEAKIKAMSTHEIKIQLCQLLVEMRMVVPIPGVKINVAEIEAEIKRQIAAGQGADQKPPS